MEFAVVELDGVSGRQRATIFRRLLSRAFVSDQDGEDFGLGHDDSGGDFFVPRSEIWLQTLK